MKTKTNEQKLEGLSAYFPYSEAQIKYLVNCSEKFRFLYVETPKVACSTIKRVLQLIEADGDQSKLGENAHNRAESPLLSPLSTDIVLDELFTGDKYFRFCFVRNPYSRILSTYLDKIVTNDWERRRLLPTLGYGPTDHISLHQFLQSIRTVPNINKDIHWTPQAYLLQQHKVNYHFIGRFESFAAGFSQVIKKIQPKAGEELFDYKGNAHRTNASSKITEFIGPAERDLIIEIFENDFKVFGYSLDPHFGTDITG